MSEGLKVPSGGVCSTDVVPTIVLCTPSTSTKTLVLRTCKGYRVPYIECVHTLYMYSVGVVLHPLTILIPTVCTCTSAGTIVYAPLVSGVLVLVDSMSGTM